jgi:hypothetical protein
MVGNYFGRGVGPKPDTLLAKGFRLAQKDSVHEWWVHPSGNYVTRNFADDRRKDITSRPEEDTKVQDGTNRRDTERSKTRKEELPSGPVIEGTEEWPAQLDPNTDPEQRFGLSSRLART